MKVAVIGSRNLNIVDIGKYLPENTTEIVSGGAKGVDTLAAEYARKNKIPLKEFLPDYPLYKKAAPLKRNIQIIEYCDMVIALWDGASRGTKFVIDRCREKGKPVEVHIICCPSKSESHMTNFLTNKQA